MRTRTKDKSKRERTYNASAKDIRERGRPPDLKQREFWSGKTKVELMFWVDLADFLPVPIVEF